MLDAMEALQLTFESVDDEQFEEVMKQVEFTIRQHASEGHRKAMFDGNLFPNVMKAAEVLKPELERRRFKVDLVYTSHHPYVLTVCW